MRTEPFCLRMPGNGGNCRFLNRRYCPYPTFRSSLDQSTMQWKRGSSEVRNKRKLYARKKCVVIRENDAWSVRMMRDSVVRDEQFVSLRIARLIRIIPIELSACELNRQCPH